MPKIMLKGEEVEIEFYREEVTKTICVDVNLEGGMRTDGSTLKVDCSKLPTYVSIDDVDDVVCNKHRLEMTPGARRRYIKIEDVPFKNPPRSASEVAFNGEDDGEYDEEDYDLTDEDVKPVLRISRDALEGLLTKQTEENLNG